jgi:hypothetical protein
MMVLTHLKGQPRIYHGRHAGYAPGTRARTGMSGSRQAHGQACPKKKGRIQLSSLDRS